MSTRANTKSLWSKKKANNKQGGTYDFDAPEYIYDDNGNIDVDAIREQYNNYAWIAQEITIDEYGETVFGEIEYRED